jgi:hypothetical protein
MGMGRPYSALALSFIFEKALYFSIVQPLGLFRGPRIQGGCGDLRNG